MWDGYDFRSVCRHCGAPLYKHGNVRWRRIVARKDVLLLDYEPDPEPWPEPPTEGRGPGDCR